jgi:NADH:ubiquinone oxidoreductase subunit 5 (subunit L)/multisubunit Na+/H+ antiporter MnhA subunit
MVEVIVWLIPVLPLLSALWIAIGYVSGRNRGELGEKQTRRVVIGCTVLSLVALLVLDGLILLHGSLPGYVYITPWFNSGGFQANISFLLDGLGLVMTHLVLLVSLLTLRFSVNYLHREAGYQRYFMIMGLFTSAMLLIVMAGNAVLLFVGWELAGVSSYLLIAYSFERPTAAGNATRAFVTNRIGDAGFIVAIVMSFLWAGSAEWPVLFHSASTLDTLHIGLVASGFLLAAMAKSAQVPFVPWIARALEGPTPSSAIFYGALMVHAGVYLLIRMQPLLEHAPELSWMITLIGAVTALYGVVGGFVQTDVKSALMFSTSGQLGLMFMACGLGWFELASWHLVAHAVWRAFQFLNAPSMMHLMNRSPRPVPRWLRRRRWLYTAALQRFWIEHVSDWLLVRPIEALARDTQAFDQQVVNRLVGLPGSIGAVSSLAQWEKQKHAHSMQLDGDSGDIGKGQGAAGKLMEWIASILHWFEEHLVMKGGEEGIRSIILSIGSALVRVDELLSHPRYLLLMLLITFVVIL